MQNTGLNCRQRWRKNTINMLHQEKDARSLALHTAAIELMRADVPCTIGALGYPCQRQLHALAG